MNVVLRVLAECTKPYSASYLRKLQALGQAASNDYTLSVVVTKVWTGKTTTVLQTPVPLDRTSVVYDVVRVFSKICYIDSINNNSDTKTSELIAYAQTKIKNRIANKDKYKRQQKRKSHNTNENTTKLVSSDNVFINENER